ncbi:MAG: hypothetical protein WD095_01125 [Candidatus Paceibacterota bacterium]
MSDQPKKINEAEMVIGGLITLAVDGVAFLLDLTVFGYIVAVPLQAFTSLATSWMMWSKGDGGAFKAKRQFTKQVANFAPWIPTCFGFFVYEVFRLNNPKSNALLKFETRKKEITITNTTHKHKS